MKQYFEFITRIARRYTLPTQCAITHDALIQEGCLGYLEAQINHPEADEKKLLNYARRSMQRAITRYVSPVSHTIEETLPAPSETDLTERQMRDDLLDSASAFLSSLNTQLAAGTITPANYRKKKQRFLHKLRKSVSQNLS